MTAAIKKNTHIGSMVLGRYRVVRALAQGGMGTVYLARNEGAAGFVKPVVIKRSLRIAGRLTDELFAREARILSNLRHPGIVGIVDFAEEDGDYVMVLDYVHGYTLSQWSRFVRRSRRSLPVELAVYAVREMLEALHYAHSLRDSGGNLLGIVHRDIKPSNVLVDVQGLVKLADFGVARTNTEVTDTSTGDSSLKGTFAYMAPELFGGADPSACTDVYSAALTLYQLIAGQNPFTTNDAALTAARALRHEPEPLDRIRPDVTRGLASAIARGMCKNPEGRFATAEELATALRAGCPESDRAGDDFRVAIARDFNDPTLAVVLDCDSLTEREEAWKRFVGASEVERKLALPLSPSELERTDLAQRLATLSAPPGAAEAAPEPDDAPTVDEAVHTAQTKIIGFNTGGRASIPEPGPAPARPRSRLPLLFAMLALGGAAVGVYLATRERPAEQPAVVMVRGDVSMEGEGDEPGAAPAPGATDDDDTAGDAPAPDPGATPADPATAPTRTPSKAARLTARFRERQGHIVRCFDRHGRSADRLAVRFHIGADGAVTQAALVPESAMDTPLGDCLLAVARGTRFGAQREPVTFRIPIEVSPR